LRWKWRWIGGARRDISAIGDPTLADAILDRLVNNAYWINLKGEPIERAHKSKSTVSAGKKITACNRHGRPH